MIMIATGTGLSPFRGFLQERAASRCGGHARAGATDLRLPAAGLRLIYEDEIRQFEAAGVVEVVTAYSRIQDGTRARVQDAVQPMPRRFSGSCRRVESPTCAEAPALWLLRWDAFAEIYRHHGVSAEEGLAWLEEQRAANRYLEDVWAAH